MKLAALLVTEFRPISFAYAKYYIPVEILDVRLDHATKHIRLIDDAQEAFRVKF